MNFNLIKKGLWICYPLLILILLVLEQVRQSFYSLMGEGAGIGDLSQDSTDILSAYSSRNLAHDLNKGDLDG